MANFVDFGTALTVDMGVIALEELGDAFEVWVLVCVIMTAANLDELLDIVSTSSSILSSFSSSLSLGSTGG